MCSCLSAFWDTLDKKTQDASINDMTSRFLTTYKFPDICTSKDRRNFSRKVVLQWLYTDCNSLTNDDFDRFVKATNPVFEIRKRTPNGNNLESSKVVSNSKSSSSDSHVSVNMPDDSKNQTQWSSVIDDNVELDTEVRVRLTPNKPNKKQKVCVSNDEIEIFYNYDWICHNKYCQHINQPNNDSCKDCGSKDGQWCRNVSKKHLRNLFPKMKLREDVVRNSSDDSKSAQPKSYSVEHMRELVRTQKDRAERLMREQETMKQKDAEGRRILGEILQNSVERKQLIQEFDSYQQSERDLINVLGVPSTLDVVKGFRKPLEDSLTIPDIPTTTPVTSFESYTSIEHLFAKLFLKDLSEEDQRALYDEFCTGAYSRVANDYVRVGCVWVFLHSKFQFAK